MPPRVRAGLAAKYGLPKAAKPTSPQLGPGLLVFTKTHDADPIVATKLLIPTAGSSQPNPVDRALARLNEADREALVCLSKRDGITSVLTSVAAIELAVWMRDSKLGLADCHRIFAEMLTTKARSSMPQSVEGRLTEEQYHRLVQATVMRLEAIPLEDHHRETMEVLLCLNAYAIIPEFVLLAQVLAGMLDRAQQKRDADNAGADDSEKTEVEPIETDACAAALEDTINWQMIKNLSLLVVTDAGDAMPATTVMSTRIRFPKNVPQVKMSFMNSTRMYKLNPIVAVAAESICDMHNPDWRAAAKWRALDGMYAVCGIWDHMMIESATSEERQRMLMVAPHAAVVGDAARTTPPPERQRASLQEELAYVLLSVANFSGVVNDYKKAQLAGKFAIEVHQESAQLSGSRTDGFFPQRVTFYLGNLLYKSGELDDALEQHVQSLTMKKAELAHLAKLTPGSPDAPEKLQGQIVGINASIASSYHQIGNIYGSKGKWQKAVNNLKDSLKLKEEYAALQPDSIAKTLKVLAYAYEQKKNLRAASECTTKELGILRETLKNNLKDPAITDCLQRMMGLRKQLKAMGQ